MEATKKTFTVSNVTTQVLGDKTITVKGTDGTTKTKRLPKEVIWNGKTVPMKHEGKDFKFLFDVSEEELFEIAAKQAVIKIQDVLRKSTTKEFFEWDFNKIISLKDLYTDKQRSPKKALSFLEMGEVQQLEGIIESDKMPESIKSQARARLQEILNPAQPQDFDLENERSESSEPTE